MIPSDALYLERDTYLPRQFLKVALESSSRGQYSATLVKAFKDIPYFLTSWVKFTGKVPFH